MRDVWSGFQRALWRLRWALGLAYGSQAELAYRMMKLPELQPKAGRFRFRWGGIEYVSASDLRGQFFEIFVERHYAFRTAAKQPVIVDAGGNIGMSAIWFKQNYPESTLTVYEADPSLSAVLTRNLASANIFAVDVQNAAVWIKDGFVAFDNLGQDKGTVNPAGAIQVRAIDLALHLPERVDLLKMDVEGAEYAIVERLCVTGAIMRVQNVVAEFHVRRTDIDSVITTLGLLRQSGMQVTLTSALGPWLGTADAASPFEIVGNNQVLMEVYAWR